MSRRKSIVLGLLVGMLLSVVAEAATKVHVIGFGKWTSVAWSGASAGEEKPRTIKVRLLLVDGRGKEYTIGTPHEITERLFVVRRAFRVNDSLPEDTVLHWQWELGGWMLVDRLTGHVSAINLPEFDVYYSAAAWFRDYAAYCGIGDDGKKIYAVVAQIGRRRPVLKKLMSNEGPPEDASPDAACPAPAWQRHPVRVSFEVSGSPKETFAIRGHASDVVSDSADDEEGTK